MRAAAQRRRREGSHDAVKQHPRGDLWNQESTALLHCAAHAEPTEHLSKGNKAGAPVPKQRSSA